MHCTLRPMVCHLRNDDRNDLYNVSQERSNEGVHTIIGSFFPFFLACLVWTPAHRSLHRMGAFSATLRRPEKDQASTKSGVISRVFILKTVLTFRISRSTISERRVRAHFLKISRPLLYRSILESVDSRSSNTRRRYDEQRELLSSRMYVRSSMKDTRLSCINLRTSSTFCEVLDCISHLATYRWPVLEGA